MAQINIVMATTILRGALSPSPKKISAVQNRIKAKKGTGMVGCPVSITVHRAWVKASNSWAVAAID